MIPIWKDVDVVVVGATTRAVTTALQRHRDGARVLVVSDLSYFGADTAGTLTCAPEPPGAVKRRLEQSLLEAGIPFLYLTRPVLVRPGFVVLAARTSLLAVTCHEVVDESAIAGEAFWNVIASEPLPGARELPAGFGEGRLVRLPVTDRGDFFGREHRLRAGLLDARVLATADIIPPVQAAPAGPPVRGEFRFAPAFLRETMGALDFEPTEFPKLGAFDVVVAGGGTAGAPAGIAAARAGARTLVIEMQQGLGGVGTVGLITAYYHGNRVGFTAALDEAVMEVDAESRAKKGVVWSPELKSAVYHRWLEEAGGTAWLGSYAFGVRMEGNRVTGVLVSTPFGAGLVEAACVVDATGNADIAAAAGAPCRVVGGDHVATQGTGLSPREKAGVRYCNSDHTFIDDTDPVGVTHAYVNARAKFPKAFDTSPLVDSRERRQIIGEVEVSPLDILAERTWPDTVFTAASNFDTHGFIVHPVFMVTPPDRRPLRAHVPYRCMLPRGVEGVLVTGLGMSAHRDAIPVIRMQADLQNQGYAAGLAAARTGRGRLRDLDVRALQRELIAAGNLAPEVATQEDSFPLPAAAVAEAARDLSRAKNVAILFAHPAQARQLLAGDPRIEAAMILGLMGETSVAPRLAEAVRATPWDEGWNYRGMGQFGPSMSRLDAMMLALARTRSPVAVPVLAEKIRQLDEQAEFSHCRVAGLAAALLPALRDAVAALLRKPGMTGHAHTDTVTVIRQANPDGCETEARNRALRELYLAAGLYRAGDVDGVGRKILETYARDLRGHFARYARAVLAGETSGELA